MKKNGRMLSDGDESLMQQDIKFIDSSSELQKYPTNDPKLKDMSDLDKKIKELTDKINGVFTCKVCGKTAKDKTHLRNHIETHMEGLSFPCAFCEKTFRSRHSLVCHRSKYHKVGAIMY